MREESRRDSTTLAEDQRQENCTRALLTEQRSLPGAVHFILTL